DWHWLFRLPPLVTGVMAILVALIPKETPEQAGYPGCIKDESEVGGTHSDDVRVSMKESFLTIFRHPLVWYYAIAYACTGAVRHSSDQLSVLFFAQYLHIDLAAQPASITWTVNIVPLIAVVGSFASGVISDKIFRGRRSPVALLLLAHLSLLLGHMVSVDGFVRHHRLLRNVIRHAQTAPLSHSSRLAKKLQLLARAPERSRRKFGPAANPETAARHFEHRSDLLGENSLPFGARSPTRVVQFRSAANVADAFQYLLFLPGEMLIEPMLEKRRDGPRQTHDRVTGELRACFRAGFHDSRHLVIGQARDDRRDHYAHGNSRGAQHRNGFQARSRR